MPVDFASPAKALTFSRHSILFVRGSHQKTQLHRWSRMRIRGLSRRSALTACWPAHSDAQDRVEGYCLNA